MKRILEGIRIATIIIGVIYAIGGIVAGFSGIDSFECLVVSAFGVTWIAIGATR